MSAATPTVPELVVVDGANVIGSRPDGWWRDRAGAAARLMTALQDQGLEQVTLVLEGAARAGVAPGQTAAVRVVHASGSGDDAIVELVAAAVQRAPAGRVTVVTADRGLRRRVEALGARTHGPSWLWRALEEPGR